MAACIRLKLNFDGSVCPQIPQRKCWFLVNKDSCNVVADLEYLIRERFELDRSQILSLSLDSYVLPSMEKIHVVRDNDTICVHAEQTDDIVDDLQVSEPTTPISESVTEVSLENEEHSTTHQIRKRKCSDVTEETSPRKLIHREILDGEGLDNDRSSNKSTEVSVLQMDKESQPKKNHSKKKKKNKKKKSLEPDERPKTPSSKSSGSSKKDNSKQKSCSKITSHRHNRSPRISSNSEKKNKSKKQEDRSPSSDCASKVSSTCSITKSSGGSTYDLRKRSASSPVSSTKSSGTLSALTPVTSAEHVENETIKSPTGLLLTVEKNHVREKKRSAAPVILSAGHIRFQSSESEVSSDDESDVDNEKQTSKQSDTSKQSETSKQSDREQKVQPGTDETFIRREQPVAQNGGSFQSPVPTPSEECNHGAKSFQNNGQFKRQNSSSPHQTGCNSRGKGSDSWRWDRGNWDKNSQLNTTQSNKSFVIENPPQESEPVPKDFTSFPSLVGPPRLGDVIAYKILELSESYCPELSSFKEGKVLGVDTATGQIEIELSHVTMVTRASKPGKFDLLWGDEEGDGDNEMNVTNNNRVDLNVSVQLGDLVDPRLVPAMSV